MLDVNVGVLNPMVGMKKINIEIKFGNPNVNYYNARFWHIQHSC